MATTNQFIILPSERLLQYNPSTQQLTVHLTTKAQDFVTSNNKLALVSGKSVKCYNIENGFSSQSEAILESYFLKKIEAATIDSHDKIVVTDKFGDIYEARSQDSFYLNSNLGIPTFMKYVKNPTSNKQYILLGDDYCKLKVYNYKNMHEITAIWYIPNSIPLDILQVDAERVVLLVKHEDKQNLKHTYKLYLFNVKDLDSPDFVGTFLYADQTETLINSEYHPCSILYCPENKQLYFLKLVDQQIQIISFSFDQNKQFTFLRQQNHILKNHVKEGNSIQGMFATQNNQRQLLISYGKFYNVENQDKSVSEKHISLKQINLNESYSINQNEFLLKLKLE